MTSVLKAKNVANLALLGALAVDDHAAVRAMLDNGADINFKSSKAGRTPLHFAAASGSPELIGLLLDLGANVNAVTERGETPLHVAARSENLGALEALVRAGADVKAKDRTGRTVEYYSLRPEKPAVTREAFRRALATKPASSRHR